MKSCRILSKSTQETIDLGVRLARHLRRGDILCLFGELGTGKTTLIKGIAKGLKVNPSKVNSPTFVLMNTYEGRLPLYHFDLYRLNNVREISSIGYEEYLYGDGVAVIEWAEKLAELLPQEHFRIQLLHRGVNERLLKLAAYGKNYEKTIEHIVH